MALLAPTRLHLGIADADLDGDFEAIGLGGKGAESHRGARRFESRDLAEGHQIGAGVVRDSVELGLARKRAALPALHRHLVEVPPHRGVDLGEPEPFRVVELFRNQVLEAETDAQIVQARVGDGGTHADHRDREASGTGEVARLDRRAAGECRQQHQHDRR